MPRNRNASAARSATPGATPARFLREGYVANAVGHPAVVAVLDDGVTEDGAVFLVLELLEGESIDARRIRLGGSVKQGRAGRLSRRHTHCPPTSSTC